MPDIRAQIAARISIDESVLVWVPPDFAPLGSRDAIDKALQRMAAAGELERLDRGLYVRSGAVPLSIHDYWAVVEAIARPDRLRVLVDGEMAARSLGLTATVPAKVTILTEARRRSLDLGAFTVEFKQTNPGRLFWVGRPAMAVVQALYWLKESQGIAQQALARLRGVVSDPVRGPLIRRDLVEGFSTLPGWMQSIVRELPGCVPNAPPQKVRYTEPKVRSGKSKRERSPQVQMVR
jgi:Family of unknown function (DUF6088)